MTPSCAYFFSRLSSPAVALSPTGDLRCRLHRCRFLRNETWRHARHRNSNSFQHCGPRHEEFILVQKEKVLPYVVPWRCSNRVYELFVPNVDRFSKEIQATRYRSSSVEPPVSCIASTCFPLSLSLVHMLLTSLKFSMHDRGCLSCHRRLSRAHRVSLLVQASAGALRAKASRILSAYSPRTSPLSVLTRSPGPRRNHMPPKPAP
jgi:hypothetical protein